MAPSLPWAGPLVWPVPDRLEATQGTRALCPAPVPPPSSRSHQARTCCQGIHSALLCPNTVPGPGDPACITHMQLPLPGKRTFGCRKADNTHGNESTGKWDPATITDTKWGLRDGAVTRPSGGGPLTALMAARRLPCQSLGNSTPAEGTAVQRPRGGKM